MKLVNLKNPVMASWMRERGARLDAPPFLSGAIEARKLLERLQVKKEPLKQLTLGREEGIFHAGRIKRQWVTDPQYGIPFLSSTDILQADLSHLALISKRAVAENPKLTIHKDWSLITRSGSIGRMAYTRPDMDGMACTEDVLRIVPNPDRILPGYLYAFLSSKFGVPLVIGSTSAYDAIIQHIEPHHLTSRVVVPRFGAKLETRVDNFVQQASSARNQANGFLRQANIKLLEHCELPPIQHSCSSMSFCPFHISSESLTRFDAAHYSPVCIKAERFLKEALPKQTKRIGEVAHVFTPRIFKRNHVDDPGHGYAYFSGSELSQLDPVPRGFLSRKAPKISEYLVKQDWLLMQNAGQPGGRIGQIVRVTPQVHQGVVSNHLMRFVCKEKTDAAYLFCVLSSRYGYLAITRYVFGSTIPQLDPHDIAQIEIPWPEEDVRRKLARPVLGAWDLQDRACMAEHEAVLMVESAIEAAS